MHPIRASPTPIARTVPETLTLWSAISVSGGSAIAIEADLSDDETISRLFDAAEDAFGPVDILVNI